MRSTRSFLDDDPYASGSPRAPVPALSSDTLLAQLEHLLASKATEIQLAGRLGEALLDQQAQLEQRIREVAEVQHTFASSPAQLARRAQRDAADDAADASEDDKEVGAETKKKLAALEEDMKRWDEGNSGLYDVVGHAAAQGVPALGAHPTPLPFDSPPREHRATGPPPDSAPHLRRPAHAAPPPAASLSQSLAPSAIEPESASAARRARNNNGGARTNDIELATEIGQSLLGEVRRLQSLLAERDQTIRDAVETKVELAHQLENEIAGRRTVEESVDKYKEENWNLEVGSQELAASLAKVVADVHKADLERQRVAKELAATRETLDLHRLDGERLTGELESLKQRHETDMANMRKAAAGLQRERSDLQGHLEGLRTELATKARGIRRVGSNAPGDALLLDGEDADEDPELAGGVDDDVFRATSGRRKTGDGFLPPPSPSEPFNGSEYGESPEASPVQRPGYAADASLAAHAQRQIATLKSALAREKAAKMDLRRQLAAGLGSPDQSWAEDDDESSSREVTPARSMRGSARRGAGRRRGSASRVPPLPSRLGRELSPGDTSIDEEDEDPDADEDDVERSFADHGDANSLFEHNFPLAGADDDNASELSFGSPRAGHANRGSVDMDPDFANMLDRDGSDNDSLRSHGSPGALANALGHRRPASISSIVHGNRPTSAMFGSTPVLSAIVWVDEGTMTDFAAPPPAPVFVPPPPVEVSHASVQATPEPAVVVQMADFGAQTEPELKVVTKEFATLTDAPPARAEAGVETDPPVVAQRSEVEIQTDPLPDPVVKGPPVPLLLSPRGMEDRALATQPSLELLTPTLAGLDDGEEHTLTIGQHLRQGAMPLDSDSDLGGETETDGEFEDARESIGAASPVPTSAAPSVRTFASLHGTTANDSDDDSDMEVLRTSPIAARRAAANVTKSKPVPVEAGVQTEPWAPLASRSTTPAPFAARSARPLTHVADKRDSINTFGRPDSGPSPVDSTFEAAAATAYLYSSSVRESSEHDGSVSDFRPESAASVLTVQSDLPTPTDKGKGRALSTSPATAAMPPPSRIQVPRKVVSPRKSNASNQSLRTTPPPRPTSPPPADLLYRAQSPTYDSEYDRRVNGLLDPSSARPRSALSVRATSKPVKPPVPVRRRSSNVSDGASLHSRRPSVASSRTSDGGFDSPMRTGGDSTDPQVIHAITQTMIGEFLYKYTKKAFSKGISEKRHKRFFWVHPYTKTLYWSSADPGAASTNQSSAKSVFIEGVRQVIDPNPFPPGLHQGSIIVKTPNREMKFTASTRERHDMWFQAINYLLARPDVAAPDPNANDTPGRTGPLGQRAEGVWTTPSKALYAHRSTSDSHLTPAQRPRTTKLSTPSTYGKRAGTIAAEFEQSTKFGSPRSLRTFSDFLGGEESVEYVDRRDIPDDAGHDDDETWEGLENVRACCDGKHDVGSLSRNGGRHHHHHHHGASSSELDLPGGRSPTRARSKSSLSQHAGSIGSKASTWGRRAVQPSPRKAAVPLPTTPLATNPNGAAGRARA